MGVVFAIMATHQLSAINYDDLDDTCNENRESDDEVYDDDGNELNNSESADKIDDDINNDSNDEDHNSDEVYDDDEVQDDTRHYDDSYEYTSARDFEEFYGKAFC